MDSFKSQCCCVCQRESQLVQSDYTLIGVGWRNLIVQGSEGRRQAQWYCPECWARRKTEKTGT